jgi:photosystem II stability/assembly factor-like uncharacterized protein
MGASAQAPSTWIEVPVPTTKNLHSIDFPTPSVGYIGGADSLLLKTTDGGLTWNPIPYTGINFNPVSAFVISDDFLELDFVTDQIGYAAVGFSTYRTADGGLTWNALNSSPSLNYHRSLYFLADGEGVIGGFQEYVISALGYQKEYIDRFTFGASSPVLISSPSSLSMDTISDIDFDLSSFGSVGLAVSTGGRIYRTIDGGTTWDSIASPLNALGIGNIPFTSVGFVNSNLAFIGYDDTETVSLAVGAAAGFLFSSDGGLTWGIDFNSATFAYPKINAIHVTSSGRTYSGQYTNVGFSQTGYIMELLDPTGIPNWIGYLVDEEINSMTSHSDTVVWGAGNNGYLVKRGPAEVLSIDETNSLYKIRLYPNPAVSFIKIELPLDLQNKSTILEIRSLDGKLLKRNQQGLYTFDIGNLPSGTYCVNILSNTKILSSQFIKL